MTPPPTGQPTPANPEAPRAKPAGADRPSLSKAVRSFDPAAVPTMSRRAYALELRSTLAFALMLTCVESSVAGAILKITYEGVVSPGVLNFAVAAVAGSKAFANVISFVWVKLAHGRDKVRMAITMQIAMALCVLLLAPAFVSRDAVGMWVVVALVIGARLIWAGFITIRSTIWRYNYTRQSRARVTGKLTAMQVVSIGILGFLLGKAMDVDPRALILFAPIGALLAMIGVWSWSQLRVRRQPALLREETADDQLRPSYNPISLYHVLRADRPFAGYMGCMFLLGSGNLMLPPLLPIIARERFGFDYSDNILVAATIPSLVMPFAIPLWAKLLDRMHVIRFRTYHCWVFLAAQLTVFAAAGLGQSWLLFVASVILGIAFGGGALAWTLGHLDFAKPHQATQYMGVHVTLTGVRGLIAPFLGVGIYQTLEWTNPGSGYWVFALAGLLVTIAALGFIRLQKHVPQNAPDEEHPRKVPVETAPPARSESS